MKFIINTSFVPYFCAIFDANEVLIETVFWEDGRESGAKIWDFTSQHKLKDQRVDFIGAVSGPGGFSHLRTSGVILNTLSFYFDIPIHQARADLIISDFLTTKLGSLPQFALNSFGTGLFIPENKKLERFPDEVSCLEKKENPTWVKLLPEEKQKYFPKKVEANLEGIEISTLKTLQAQKSSPLFIPDYEYPPVQA